MKIVIYIFLFFLLFTSSSIAEDKVIVVPLKSSPIGGEDSQVLYNNNGKLAGTNMYFTSVKGEANYVVKSENSFTNFSLHTETDTNPVTLILSKKWAGWGIGMHKGSNDLVIDNGSAVSIAIQNETGNVGFGAESHEIIVLIQGYLQLDLISGPPPSTDCDQANERGRMKTDSATATLYLCSDSGWVAK